MSDVMPSVPCHYYAKDPVEGHILENSPTGGTPHMKGVGMLVGNFE